jgi:hypothetical protein
MTSIFGNAASTGGNRHLVEFRAGKMNMIGKMVHPDLRKGLVFVYSAEDGLIHFCWKDRTTGNVEDDLIIFPDDCEFKRVDQCKTGRVYILKFKSSGRKLFFWLQEPETDKDEEWCRRVNDVMNNPPSSNMGSGSSGNRTEEGLQYMLNNMSQQQLMQLFGGVAAGGQMGLSSLLGSINRSSSGRNANASLTSSSAANRSATTTTTAPTATAVTPTNTAQPTAPRAPRKTNNTNTTSGTQPPATPSSTGSDTSRVLLTELQNYLAGINTGSGSKQNVDLSTSFNTETINSILSDNDRLSSLAEHLPNTSSTSDAAKKEDIKSQLKDTLISPQFQQALSMFSSALQSGQLGPVVSQFKLNDQAVEAANNGDIEQFIKALENASIKSSDAPAKDAKDKADEENKETKK